MQKAKEILTEQKDPRISLRNAMGSVCLQIIKCLTEGETEYLPDSWLIRI